MILLSIGVIILGLMFFIINPKSLRTILQFWVKGLWFNIVTTVGEIIDKVAPVAGDVIDKLPDLADQFWTALTTFVKRLLYVIVVDLLILVALIVFDYHAGILAGQ